MLTRSGGRYSTSVGGPLTGRGGDFIIIDDPLKPNDAMSEARRDGVNEWYDLTVPSRLDDKTRGATIVVGQRLHIEDLIGHLLAKEEGWKHLCIPAIAESDERIAIGKGRFHLRRRGEVLHSERESISTLDALRVFMGAFNFSAQYQQCPLPAAGELIKWKWFQFYAELPPRGPGDLVIQSWDTASKATELSDYSACTTALTQGDCNYLIDISRERLLYPHLRRRVVEHARAFGATVVLIEDKGSGTSLIQDLAYADEMSGIDVIGVLPAEDKVTRMATQSIAIEAGKVLLPEYAPWTEDFRKELLQFPKGNYDDQVDSLSQLLRWRREVDHVGVYF